MKLAGLSETWKTLYQFLFCILFNRCRQHESENQSCCHSDSFPFISFALASGYNSIQVGVKYKEAITLVEIRGGGLNQYPWKLFSSF